MEGSEPRVRIPLLKRKPKIKVQIKEVVVEGRGGNCFWRSLFQMENG